MQNTDTDTDPDTLTRLALDLMRSWGQSPDEVWTYMPSEALPIDADGLGNADFDS
jgi:hypothetical protein